MRNLALAAILAAAAGGLLLSTRSSAGDTAAPVASPVHVVTLYRYDPLKSALSLASGTEGRVFQDHYARPKAVDVDFGNFNADALTIATDDNRRGIIVDLGSSADLAKRYGYVEPPGGGQGFASLHFEGARLVITRGVEGRFQPLAEISGLLTAPVACASAPAAVGHIYLVRLLDKLETTFERLAKLMVIEHKAGETCTIRWELLTR